MTWNDTKQNAADPNSPAANEQLTPEEYNNMVVYIEGLTQNSQVDVSSNAWVIDEDNMASNDDTKVPTQQSVKAYVDSNTPDYTVTNEDLTGLNISELNNDSGYITDYTVTETDVTDHQSAILIEVSQITDISTNYQATSDKGAPNGYASLDGSGKVPTSQLPPISSGIDISNDGTQSVSGATDINFNQGLTVTDDGDGTVTINADIQESTLNHNELSFMEDAADGVAHGHITDGAQTISGKKTFSEIELDWQEESEIILNRGNIVHNTAYLMNNADSSGIRGSFQTSASQFDVVVLKPTEANKADATTEANIKGIMGIVTESSVFTVKYVLLTGYIRNNAWSFTVGEPVFVSPTTAGELTQTTPSNTGEFIRCVGYASASNILYFNPDNAYYEVG